MQRCLFSAVPRSSWAPAVGPRMMLATKRAIHDIAITRTGKPIIRQPSGGRSSIGGHTVTVFGASGFLGRYIVNKLANSGCTVVIPYREEMTKRHLKVTGDLGKVVFIEFDLRNTPSIEESVRHSDIVFNLIGRDYTTKNFTYEDVHVEGTQRIAEAVAKYDVDRFIQVSSYNADPKSPSKFYATKGRAEEDARLIFPETTIVRPSPMFGFEDRLLLKLASVTNLFTANNMAQRFRPVHVTDVGKALQAIAYDDNTAGQTFELFGPQEYSMAELAHIVDRDIIHNRRHVNLPKPVLKGIARALDYVWWPTIAPDEVEREFIDQKIDPAARTFEDLGITPENVDDIAYQYTRHFRPASYYDLPPMTEKEKREERKYLHVEHDLV
ncbi:uncharacterized protein LAJ45_04194 [Morchella importuna]|nr:uncharacterized protein LAJ45_04194 [Morchella importuna]KAH8151573.1 hypothetical protein LAJ45_04194 [Morchella importuna]